MKFYALRAQRPRGLFRWILLPVAAPLLLSGCGKLSEAMTAHTDVVARAAGKEFKVEEAAKLIASNPQLPSDPQVVRALADAWADYTLLATAVAEDSALSALNLEAFVEPAREQAMMMKLREQVIRADTTFTDQEIQQQWGLQGPGVELRARHILLRIPAEATPAQRDSVRQQAESLRQRASQGGDFAALARQFSQDPGSAQQGGDLGFFSRGRMVAPFEEAAFQLKPGEVSPVVETPFGYHVIQAVDRRQPELGGQRAEFRNFLVQRAQQEAETAYLDSLSRAANVQVQPGGLAVVREIAGRPETPLRGRAAEREIATYTRGSFTAGEFQEFIRTQPAQALSVFSTAPDEQLKSYVEQLTRKELLLQQARSRNIGLSKAEEDSIRSEARQAVRQVLQATGLQQLAGKKVTPAVIDQHVMTLLEGAVTGRVQLVPLGRLGFALRDLYPAEINEGTFTQVVQRLEKLRANQPAPAPGAQPVPGGQPTPGGQPMPMPMPQPAPQPDTAR